MFVDPLLCIPTTTAHREASSLAVLSIFSICSVALTRASCRV